MYMNCFLQFLFAKRDKHRLIDAGGDVTALVGVSLTA